MLSYDVRQYLRTVNDFKRITKKHQARYNRLYYRLCFKMLFKTLFDELIPVSCLNDLAEIKAEISKYKSNALEKIEKLKWSDFTYRDSHLDKMIHDLYIISQRTHIEHNKVLIDALKIINE